MQEYMKRQDEVLNFITTYIISFGCGPTYKEICVACRIKSRSHAYKIVNHLIKFGHLEKSGKPNLNRTIVIPKKNNLYNEFSNNLNNSVKGIYIYD